MDAEEGRDVPRMCVDESPVASTSTSSADAVAPEATADGQAARQDDIRSTESTGAIGVDPTASTSNTLTSESTPQAGTSASGAAAAPVKSEPETRVWKPVPPGTMPRPRRSHIGIVYLSEIRA
jgi:hypothetical protein